MALEPVLTPGARGAFDDAGVSVSSIVRTSGKDLLYYTGWNVGGSLPWRTAIGVAVGDAAAGRFERLHPGPLMDRGPVDPFGLTYPWVLRVGDGDWRMWFGSTQAWSEDGRQTSHVLRAATSADGVDWRRSLGAVIIPVDEELGLARPTVLFSAAGAEMWFSRRTAQGYGLGHARSADGCTWARDAEAGIEPDPQGWELGSVAYPCVFEAGTRRWLLYNGHGYGRTGFGLAVWRD